MLFNSLTYLLFMLIAVPLVVFGPKLVRNGTILLGSLAFYGFWRPDFLALIIFTAFVDYTAGKHIAATSVQSTKRLWLVLSISLNLLVLAFFKYTYFLAGAGDSILHTLGIDSHMYDGVRNAITIILPLGISFYTFESMSYTIDVYRGVQAPVRNFRVFQNFVMFWPKLIAGPILRTSELVPQLENYKRPTKGEVAYGLEEILQGLFKKLVIADSVAPLVDAGFALPPSQLGMLDAWTLAFMFGFQIYFDFAGYSTIALGSARVMGFQFPRNFNWPYLATSPRDFWRRWHISLSTWIRDYLYLPLQGVAFRGGSGQDGKGGRASPAAPKSEDAAGKVNEDASEARRTFALLATWFIMGLWHGAAWTFAAWGVWHAFLVLGHRFTEGLRIKLPMWFRVVGGWAFTVSFSMLGWIFFRAQSMEQALTMVARAFDVRTIRTMALRENVYLTAAVVMIGFLLTAGVWNLNQRGKIPAWIKLPGIVVVHGILIMLVFVYLRQVKSFIYFQF